MSSDPPGTSRHCGEFLSRFDVSYDDERPYNALTEISGQSADINKGYGGSYVWLIPRNATTPGSMVDNVWIDITSTQAPDRHDIAKGAGGDYRYMAWSNNTREGRFITDISFWRCSNGQNSPPDGWQGMTKDINDGRGGDFLYLIWKTKQYTGGF
ncbi:hypothetical protein F5Y18DRAFT_399055 [Xylariaceae sp. FL1019]|nr:hypothetical protein F5Y18DRAFT_399055 [Xylariaceae sp. FL1019]